MAISKMKKLTFAVVSSLRDKLLAELQKLDAVQIDSVEEEGGGLDTVAIDVSELEDQKKDLATAISRIEDLFSVKIPAFEVTTSEAIQKVQEKYNLKELTEKLDSLDRQTKDNEMRIQNASQELDQIKRWSSVVDDMGPLNGTNPYVRAVLGYISESAYSNMAASINDVTDLAAVLSAWVQDKEVYCCVVAETVSLSQN